jgi:hypothetical protein
MDLAFKELEYLIPPPIKGKGQECLTYTIPEWITLSDNFSLKTYEEYHPIYVMKAMASYSLKNEKEAFKLVRSYYRKCTCGMVQKLFILEYLLRLGCTEWIKRLLLEDSSDPENDELRKVFSIYIAQAETQIDDTELIDRAFNMSSSCLEINIASIISHLYGISRLRLQEPFTKLIKAVESMLLLCKNQDLLTIFKIQLGEMYLVSILCRNTDPKHVRNACQLYYDKKDLLHQFPTLEISLCHIIAHSYMFESFMIAKSWIMKGRALTKNVHPQRREFIESSLNSSLDIFRSLWQMELDIPPASTSEKAHRFMVTGDTDTGTRLLDSLHSEKGSLTFFEHYYLAIGKDSNALREVQLLFLHSRNYYYAKLIDFYLLEGHKKT